MAKNNSFYALLPVISGISFGSSGFFVRSLTEAGFNSMAVLSTRTILSVVMLGIYLWIFDRSLLKVRLRDLPLLACGGTVGMTMISVFFNISVLEQSLSLAAVLISLAPVFALFISYIVFREKITTKKVICVIMALAGAVLVSGVLEEASIKVSVLGIVTGLLSGFFNALIGTFSKAASNRGYQGVTITFYNIIFMAIVTSMFSNWGAVFSYMATDSVKHIGIMVAHSIMIAVIPYLLLNISLGHIEAGKASILLSSEPVSAMLLGTFFYHEPLTFLTFSGMMITLIALGVMGMDNTSSDQTN